MAVTATPIFLQTPKCWYAQVSTANTARDGTGTIATVVTGGTNGSKIDRIFVFGVGTVTAGVVRLFISDGSTTRLYYEIMVSAITPSASVQGWFGSLDCSLPGNEIIIPNGYTLKASTHNAETFNVFAFGGDF